ncbi:MAG: PVC-type heme-binding CxxCH protein [Akkermansiaceae bacterium]
MRNLFPLCVFPLLAVSSLTAETFPAANGLERSLVAKEPLLKNPISVSVDVDGTIYATETTRRKAADLDIRQYFKHGWVPYDVGLTSVEDKRAFFRERLDGTNKLVKDHNKDGKHDITDLTMLSEKVIRLRDTNGDGVMDQSNIFAEEFNTEVTGIAAGTLAWRSDVYATIAPDVWKLRDTDGDGVADQRLSLAHGFGVHIAYAGHDMHGLILGPDGKLYWSIGDKGVNVTTKDGKNFYAPHEGAVLRCNPDGSDFEIFARGLRNPQEIAFDKYGNLFSVDNDSDQKGERERFLHITEGSDTGWRNYYQYRKSDYNPWMAENIWEPTGKFQPAYITPTNENYSDGPAGFAYNPGTALNAKYEDAFFVTEFPKGNLRSFKVKPKGATFEMTDEHIVDSGPKIVGISIGPDGGLYSADWSGGYPLNNKGAIWKIDDPKEAGSKIRKEVASMLKEGPAKISTEELLSRLSHRDMRIRLDAQWELAKREPIAELHRVITSSKSEQLAIIHATWALSQTGRFFEKIFHHLITSENPELRAQAAKHAAETSKGRIALLTRALADSSPQVRFHAATAIWKIGDNESIDSVITMLAENDDQDAYLRHAGVLALTASTAEEIATKTLEHKSTAVRLAAAVAFRRLSSPLAAELLADPDPKVVAEAARAIFDDPAITSAYPALADLLRTNPNANPPAIRRSIAANRYLANANSATRLANFAANDKVATDLRLAALEALASWAQASTLNPVDGRHDPLEPADPEIAKAAFMANAPQLQKDLNKEVASETVTVLKSLGITSDPKDLEKIALNSSANPSERISALTALQDAASDRITKLLPMILKDQSSHELRIHAAKLLAEQSQQKVVDYAAMAIMKSEQIEEQQQAVLLLGKMKSRAAKELLKNYSTRFGKGEQSRPYLHQEFSEAIPGFSKTIPKHSASLIGGSITLGEKIFNEHLAAQCTACHRIGKDGSEVGPPLTDVGNKGREYILESLVNPQAKITPGYGAMALKTKNGVSIAGTLLEETNKTLTLLLPDKTKQTINLDDIETRTKPISTMPPMGNILTDRELRDLVAYLSGLKK